MDKRVYSIAGVIAGAATKVAVDKYSPSLLADQLEKPRTIDLILGIFLPVVIARKSKDATVSALAANFSWGYVCTVITDDAMSIILDKDNSIKDNPLVRVAAGSVLAVGSQLLITKFMPGSALDPIAIIAGPGVVKSIGLKGANDPRVVQNKRSIRLNNNRRN